eukprot:CAMPEP_0119311928 /NCGR_PEP_ID=MMETSP1333-20130426/24474_1 /TAXON_ID=418940 /ORGANISM="Scyphosphaera apsteinii, Strain RCC1455" /LENGTH=78 /DNA_ID=CAMNT_0007316439 /DNA_START=9 /DNA_END=245 /DNA_ORIENTATION=+
MGARSSGGDDRVESSSGQSEDTGGRGSGRGGSSEGGRKGAWGRSRNEPDVATKLAKEITLPSSSNGSKPNDAFAEAAM